MCLILVFVTAALGAKGSEAGSTTEASTRGDDVWLLRAPLLPLVLAVVSGLVALYALLLRFAFDAKNFKLPPTATSANPVLVAATLIAGALTAAYAVLRLRAHLLAEARSKLEVHSDFRADERHRSDQEAALVDRFSKAVELLAAPQPISRIAGAHLVLALGDEWPTGTQRCLDVLISHLRGLRENNLLTEETVPRGVREEVRLITSEIFRRLSTDGDHWNVRAGDFSGTALDGVDLESVNRFASLDFRGAHGFGDLSIPADSSPSAPLLADLQCDGDLSVACSPAWTELDMSRAVVAGAIDIAGESPAGEITGTELQAGGSLNLAFDTFHSNVMLDGVDVQEEIRIGLETLGASFGIDETPVGLSLANATFGRLALQRLTRAPQVDLSGATGAVDLTASVFAFEVNANNLDATAGLQLRGTRFEEAFTLDGARFPHTVDLDGVVLSEKARSAIESSVFTWRDRMLAATGARHPTQLPDLRVDFAWREAIEPLRDQAGPQLMDELERRLGTIEANLPLDWSNKPSFQARLVSEVSRAVAKTLASQEVEDDVRSALLTIFQARATTEAAT